MSVFAMAPTQPPPDFTIVTEMAGQKISTEQLLRTCHRYHWAARYMKGKDGAELGCGAGQGLSFLNAVAGSLKAGDISPDVLARARAANGNAIELGVFDAAQTPYGDRSFDVVLLFEALYYLPDAGAFMREARRILRPGGTLLIATANKDLFDFTPSEFSSCYRGIVEMSGLCGEHGFQPAFYGYMDVSKVSLRQRALRPVKFLASRLNIVPKTMTGKALLKKFYFGDMTEMPDSIAGVPFIYVDPKPLSAERPDRRHKVIYCAATKAKD
jgi:SAM-dependent methyltransferase